MKRQAVQLPVRDTSKQWSLKIKASQFVYLKDDPDFLTMVKFGRAINALSFASTVVANSMQDNIAGREEPRRIPPPILFKVPQPHPGTSPH